MILMTFNNAQKQPAEVFYKKSVLNNLIKKRRFQTQGFSCKFYEIFKNNFLQNTSGCQLLKEMFNKKTFFVCVSIVKQFLSISSPTPNILGSPGFTSAMPQKNS